MTHAATKPAADRQTLPDADCAGRPILYFDGVCGLCSWVVDFVIRHDRHGRIRFAPLQGETARHRLPQDDTSTLDTMVLVTEEGIFRRSAAAVRVLWRLGPAWRILGGLVWVIPWPLRDLGYRCVAAIRYRFFGKHETCRVPTPEEQERFLP